jgi:hypothetical protein
MFTYQIADSFLRIRFPLKKIVTAFGFSKLLAKVVMRNYYEMLINVSLININTKNNQ